MIGFESLMFVMVRGSVHSEQRNEMNQTYKAIFRDRHTANPARPEARRSEEEGSGMGGVRISDNLKTAKIHFPEMRAIQMLAFGLLFVVVTNSTRPAART